MSLKPRSDDGGWSRDAVRPVIDEIRREFYRSSKQRGHHEDKITEVWELAGFAGYASAKRIRLPTA